MKKVLLLLFLICSVPTMELFAKSESVEESTKAKRHRKIEWRHRVGRTRSIQWQDCVVAYTQGTFLTISFGMAPEIAEIRIIISDDEGSIISDDMHRITEPCDVLKQLPLDDEREYYLEIISGGSRCQGYF
ncbi:MULTISPECIES: hypothetical protein [Bacteroidales]|uniref:hypothetical protein n=1 Tax=Bacteroidales TaxID=171549 RepID=UPI0013D1A772|nr:MULTISPECIES: hypothetical protein [Bacteroidales]MDH6313103.1 hypothetical protein [Parabacteroides sp. PFB2-10]NDV82875.1 hypothetical protein [Bacteroides sp. 51]